MYTDHIVDPFIPQKHTLIIVFPCGKIHGLDDGCVYVYSAVINGCFELEFLSGARRKTKDIIRWNRGKRGLGASERYPRVSTQKQSVLIYINAMTECKVKPRYVFGNNQEVLFPYSVNEQCLMSG